MDKNAIWKWLIFIVLVTTSLVLVTPPGEKIRLGLDLKGGTSFTVAIDEERIREDLRQEDATLTDEQVEKQVQVRLQGAQSRALEILRNRVDRLGIAEPIIYPGKDNRIIIQLPGITEDKRKEAEQSILSVAFLEFRIVHKRSAEMTDALLGRGLAPEGYRIVMLGNRPYYARDPSVPDSALDEAFRYRLGKFEVPDAEYEFLLERVEEQGQNVFRPHFVKRRAELTGEYLQSAAVDYQSLGQPVVDLTFDSRGAKKFANITTDYAPGGAKNPSRDRLQQLAIVLDGTLYSAPTIREAIIGGRAEISGSFSLPEATLLANILNAGSLPAPVKIVERRVVDPSLGADSIRSGISAAIYGCLAVVVMMALYYRMSGLLADLALVLNVVLMPLGLVVVAGFLDIFAGSFAPSSGVKLPVLTLPGIAGIALTIGMAVDANVLIFERIREEIRAGKSFAGAVQAGYERAFTAIFDSNITTIITGIILFLLGAGPVRGYAVTLTGGILVSLYTAVVVTRMVFNLIASKTNNVKLLSMMSMFEQPKLDFVGKWKLAMSGSAVLIVLSWGIMVANGVRSPASVFGVDFTGGSSVTLTYDTKVSAEDLRAAISGAGVQEAAIQYQESMDAGGKGMLEIKVSSIDDGHTVQTVLGETFASAGFKVMQEDDVGPQVGRELKTRAFMAMFWSLVVMIIYISIRFEFGFALGAVGALFHDVFVTVGICHLAGFQMNLTVVAALMTIVGYSVNDTIVIFDRIRENLRMVQNKSFMEICNLSMNQTLSRTLLTNLLTFVCVLSLLVFGGGAIKDFAFAMFIGMIAGTYSTIYIATPIVLLWYRFKTPDLGKKTVVK